VCRTSPGSNQRVHQVLYPWRQQSNGCSKTHETANFIDKEHTNEARRATTSSGLNPASAKRAKITSVESNGAGTVLAGAGAVALGRPRRNSNWGAPGQLLMPTAPASWMLQEWTSECSMAGLVIDPNAQIARGNGSTESREELRLRPRNVGDSTVGGILGFNVPKS